jgi:hypothetical protein
MSSFSFSRESDVTCNLQVKLLSYSQTEKEKRKRSQVGLAEASSLP